MCEKRPGKIQKASSANRLRETRRIQRIIRMTPSPASEEPLPAQLPHMIPIDKAVQNKVILELAWKTIALMQKNKLIQQKIIALQKETSEFVANIMQNPENRRRYLNHMRLQAETTALAQDMTFENKENNNIIFKMEPEE